MLCALSAPVISTTSRRSDVVGMCAECLKDLTAKMMIQTKTFANLQDRIKGIEHLKGKWSSPGAGTEALMSDND